MKNFTIATFLTCLSFVPVTTAQAADLFNQPDKICKSLETEGLKTRSGWKASSAFIGEYTCLSNMIEIGSSGRNGLASNIALYVNGSQPNRVDDITIKININNETTRTIALNRLIKAAETLYTAFDMVFPKEMVDAVKNATPKKISTQYGELELVHEPSKIDSYKIVMRSQMAIDKENASKQNSAGDFDKCIKAVAAISGHNMSSLNGDGDPVQENNYKSFFIEGPNNDQFFCEAHSGNKYKIKAALGGKYPFRYIDEGTF